MRFAYVSIALVAIAWLLPPSASAEAGGEGIGPVIGYSSERSWSFGWELSLTRGLILAKGSLGGVYHVDPKGDDPFTLHYLAWEPWLLIGGTLGLGVTDGPTLFRPVYGAWEGFPIAVVGESPWDGDGEDQLSWLLTFTVGIRFYGSLSQIYFAPKLWRFRAFQFSS